MTAAGKKRGNPHSDADREARPRATENGRRLAGKTLVCFVRMIANESGARIPEISKKNAKRPWFPQRRRSAARLFRGRCIALSDVPHNDFDFGLTSIRDAGLIPLFRLRRMPIPRDGLEHTHAVSLGVDERDILPHAGYLHRPAEHFTARMCYFLD